MPRRAPRLWRASYLPCWLISLWCKYAVTETQLDQVFAALADPTRRAILARLATGEATVNQLAEPLPMSLPSVSKHLKVLEAAGLISRGREAQWRPCRLEPQPLQVVDSWLERYRRHWEGSFDKMAALLERLQKPAGLEPKPTLGPKLKTKIKTKPTLRPKPTLGPKPTPTPKLKPTPKKDSRK